MLKELIESGYGEGLNCAEKIIRGANEVYELGLSEDATRLLAGFGGGLAVGAACGALCGAIAVISHMFVKDDAHKSDILKPISQEYLEGFNRKMGSIQCKDLKEKYYDDETGCSYIIITAAEMLDEIIEKYDEQRVR